MSKGHRMLTDEQVTTIRTSGMTDTHFARLYKVTPQCIYQARRAITYKYVKTPPDIAPRMATGRRAVLNPAAKSARTQRQWL